jgi:gas vesicle protein
LEAAIPFARIRVTISRGEVFMTDDANNVEQDNYESEGSSAVLGFALLLIGFAAGAIVAALMTPKTGKQMRRELRRKIDDAREAMEDWSEHADDLRERASDLADKAGEWAGAAREKVAPFAKKFQS